MQNAEQEFAPEPAGLVPLALIALEADEPIELVADRFGDDVVLDDVGMRSVPALTARQFFTELAEQMARLQEQSRRLQEVAPPPVPPGIRRPENADPAMTAFEVMLAADADADADRPDPNKRISPAREFFEQRFGPPRKVAVENERQR